MNTKTNNTSTPTPTPTNALRLIDTLPTQSPSSPDPAQEAVCFVEIKQRYGNTVYHPACHMTRLVVALKGQKELTRQDIDTLKAFGFPVLPKPTGWEYV